MFDIAIIGGGLAGCQAAVTLAARHHRVLLLEAGTYPRPKVCGEFLSPECVALFAGSGFLPRLHALNPVPIQTLRITAPNGREWHARFPAQGLGISRFALDQALAQYAADFGVEVHDSTRVTQIEGCLEEGFCLTAQTAQGLRTFQASTLIAAHGRHSNLDRVLKRNTSKQHALYIGLKQHFIGPTFPGHIDLHVFQGGYCGMSQVEDGSTNVCLLVRQDVFQKAGNRIAPFIEWMGCQNRFLGSWLAQATPVYPEWLSIAHVSLATKTPVEHDILMAGDAGGMIAPLAGDGMAMALHGGTLAACALDRYLTQAQDGPTMIRDYTRTWRKTFASRLQLGRALQSVMLRPALLAPSLQMLNSIPSIGNWLIKHTRDLGLLE